MEYIQITDSKLKIICEEEELQRYGLSAQSIEYKDEGSRKLIEDILDGAKRSLGFESKKYRILVQLFPCADGGCEIFISRLGLLNDTEGKRKKDSEKADERKNSDRPHESREELFFFERLDYLIEVCKRLSRIDDSKKSDAFYLEGEGYFLLVELESDALEEYGIATLDEFSFICEFGERLNAKARYPYLCERAKRLCKSNAVKILGRI